MLIFMSPWTVLKDLVKKRFPDKKYFYSPVKGGTTSDNGKKLDGHISNEDYLTCKKVWNECTMIIMITIWIKIYCY